MALAAGATVTALVVGPAAGSETALPQNAQAGPALDDIPGFGRSLEAVMRDEAISYWEAWKRDAAVQECMQSEGFNWEPEVLYPEEAVADVARYLDAAMSSSGTDTETAEARNARVAAALDEIDRDRYFQALYGETAAAIDYANGAGGQLPEGRDADTFAAGGCRGASDAAVGSIWNLRRTLGPEFSDLHRRERQAPELRTQQLTFQVCAAEEGLSAVVTPADVDKALAEGGKRGRAADAAQSRCAEVWDAMNEEALDAAAEAFRAAHVQALDAQTREYGNALDVMRQDPEFLRFLSQASARQPQQMHGNLGPEQEASGS